MVDVLWCVGLASVTSCAWWYVHILMVINAAFNEPYSPSQFQCPMAQRLAHAKPSPPAAPPHNFKSPAPPSVRGIDDVLPQAVRVAAKEEGAVHACAAVSQCSTVQGLITVRPAASNGLASRVATMKPWRLAVAAM